MDTAAVRKLIEELQMEIRNAETSGEEERGMLRRLDYEIQEFLRRTAGGKLDVNPAAIKRLEEVMHHFEATHPAMTNLISQLLNDISAAGI
jgi:hypothetical protein